ncbi:MAG: SpoIVB peptidase S55 domain-containing protein, partial [Wujia sp.]
GETCSPCINIIKPGDYITGIDGIALEDKTQLIDYILKSNGKKVTINIIRDEKDMSVTVTPVKTEDGYRLGIWVKDDISGIGTLTYIYQDGFGALGHSINDNDTGTLFKVSDGAIYSANIINIVKSGNGCPGRLEGIIDYSSSNILGRINNNDSCGIDGYMTKKGIELCDTGEWMPVADKTEAHKGEAYLLSYVSGQKEYYSVEIVNVDISNRTDGKCLEIKVTDERLINLTSGIVQGMSGTPIIQDGKLLGAVTHVFVKDSTRGYGIFVQDMIQ